MVIHSLEIPNFFIVTDGKKFSVFVVGTCCEISTVPIRFYINLAVSMKSWDAVDQPKILKLFKLQFGIKKLVGLSLRQLWEKYEVGIKEFYQLLPSSEQLVFIDTLKNICHSRWNDCEFRFINSPTFFFT